MDYFGLAKSFYCCCDQTFFVLPEKRSNMQIFIELAKTKLAWHWTFKFTNQLKPAGQATEEKMPFSFNKYRMLLKINSDQATIILKQNIHKIYT